MPNDLFTEDFVVDHSKDWLSELVGPGKKYADDKELAVSRAEADAHIKRLEAEQLRLRDELSTRIKYEEFIDKLNTVSLPTGSSQQPHTGDEPPKETAIKTEDIERLVEQKLSQKQQENLQQQNLSSVMAKLQESFGPNYAQHLKRHSEELGMSQAQVQNLAATNPKALYRLLGIDGAKAQSLFEGPPRTQTTFVPQATGGKNDSFYEKLRKEDPNTYWSPQVQNEIFNRIKEIGPEVFYGSSK